MALVVSLIQPHQIGVIGNVFGYTQAILTEVGFVYLIILKLTNIPVERHNWIFMMKFA
jgi:hypothetical protein